MAYASCLSAAAVSYSVCVVLSNALGHPCREVSSSLQTRKQGAREFLSHLAKVTQAENRWQKALGTHDTEPQSILQILRKEHQSKRNNING